MRVLPSLLIVFFAVDCFGWALGEPELVEAFYPPNAASPRYYEGDSLGYGFSYIFAKSIWVHDFAMAVNERRQAANMAQTVWSFDLDFLGREVFESEALHEIKQALKGAIPAYVNIQHKSGGNYNGWYSQWGDVDSGYYAGFGYPTNIFEYISDVVPPPNFSFTAESNVYGPVTNIITGTEFFDVAGLPTNFFDYTPVRFLGATTRAFTNEHTEAGGAGNWNTLDYGWEALARALSVLTDLSAGASRVQEVSWGLSEGGNMADSGGGGTLENPSSTNSVLSGMSAIPAASSNEFRVSSAVVSKYQAEAVLFNDGIFVCEQDQVTGDPFYDEYSFSGGLYYHYSETAQWKWATSNSQLDSSMASGVQFYDYFRDEGGQNQSRAAGPLATTNIMSSHWGLKADIEGNGAPAPESFPYRVFGDWLIHEEISIGSNSPTGLEPGNTDGFDAMCSHSVWAEYLSLGSVSGPNCIDNFCEVQSRFSAASRGSWTRHGEPIVIWNPNWSFDVADILGE